MNNREFTLEFLSPCMCAGANQAHAELRPSAVRGQLRWWFRAVGGSAQDERDVFGGMAGKAKSSAIIIRISNIQSAAPWKMPALSPNSPDSYVWHFASVSGKTPGSGRTETGPRWQPEGALSAGTRCTLRLIQTRPLPEHLQRQLDFALRAFLQLGGIGLRVTRGLGAFHCDQEPLKQATIDELKRAGFQIENRTETKPDFPQLAKDIGNLVKGTRSKEGFLISQKKGISTPSPLGASELRQTSAVYFRPIRSSLNQLGLIVFEAPQSRVLGPESRTSKPIVDQKPSRLVPPERRR